MPVVNIIADAEAPNSASKLGISELQQMKKGTMPPIIEPKLNFVFEFIPLANENIFSVIEMDIKRLMIRDIEIASISRLNMIFSGDRFNAELDSTYTYAIKEAKNSRIKIDRYTLFPITSNMAERFPVIFSMIYES